MAEGNLLRERSEGTRVTYIELFFDLVFVFAVTQLSHALLADLTLHGAMRIGLLVVAMWWVWIYTSWVTNWVDPERTPVRLMLLALMVAGLVYSTSLPYAYGHGGWGVAGGYVAMQLGRCFFMLRALHGVHDTNFRNFQRITAWLGSSAIFWLAGAGAPGASRVVLWAIALAIELASAAAGFWTPGLGRSRSADWEISGAHMAERCALFVIIALGESILVTGATFSHNPWNLAVVAAFASAFLGSVAMWWLYFDGVSVCATETIEHAADPGRLGRLGYTYMHLPIVGGIIVSAVADELSLAHPLGHAGPGALAVSLGGPALYLVGLAAFERATVGRFTRAPLAGFALIALLSVAFALSQGQLPLLALAAGTTASLFAAAFLARRRRPAG